MKRREIILFYRTSRQIKGHKAGIIYLKANSGKIYNGGQSDFILSIGKENLFFQKISFFMKKLVPQKDFNLALSRIKSYNLREQNLVTNCLTLYTFEKYYIEIFYNTKTADTYETEMNIAEIIKILESRGVKPLE